MTEERSERPRRSRPTQGSGSARPSRQGGGSESPRRKYDSDRKPAGSRKWDKDAPQQERSKDRPRRSEADRKGGERKPWDKDAPRKSAGADGERPRRKFDGDRKRDERGADGAKRWEKGDRPQRPNRGDGKDFKPRRSNNAERGPRRFDRDQSRDERPRRNPDEVVIERAPRERVEFPPLPDNVLSEDLHISVRAQLKTLSQDNQEFVARHLQMVALMIDHDPELAHRHALAASKKGGRIAVVRETLGITAYTIGDYALALRELLTHRRISGLNDQLPLIIDCERGMGRPERGIEAATGVDRSKLDVGVRINLAIALSGARLDQDQPKLAQQELEIKELSPKAVYEQSPLLFRSYAEVLRELGKDGTEWDDLATRAERALAEVEGETFAVLEELELPKSKDSNADR